MELQIKYTKKEVENLLKKDALTQVSIYKNDYNIFVEYDPLYACKVVFYKKNKSKEDKCQTKSS